MTQATCGFKRIVQWFALAIFLAVLSLGASYVVPLRGLDAATGRLASVASFSPALFGLILAGCLLAADGVRDDIAVLEWLPMLVLGGIGYVLSDTPVWFGTYTNQARWVFSHLSILILGIGLLCVLMGLVQRKRVAAFNWKTALLLCLVLVLSDVGNFARDFFWNRQATAQMHGLGELDRHMALWGVPALMVLSGLSLGFLVKRNPPINVAMGIVGLGLAVLVLAVRQSSTFNMEMNWWSESAILTKLPHDDRLLPLLSGVFLGGLSGLFRKRKAEN